MLLNLLCTVVRVHKPTQISENHMQSCGTGGASHARFSEQPKLQSLSDRIFPHGWQENEKHAPKSDVFKNFPPSQKKLTQHLACTVPHGSTQNLRVMTQNASHHACFWPGTIQATDAPVVNSQNLSNCQETSICVLVTVIRLAWKLHLTKQLHRQQSSTLISITHLLWQTSVRLTVVRAIARKSGKCKQNR